MLLSISSFKHLSSYYWAVTLCTGTLLATSLIYGAEHNWRAMGYSSGIIDSPQLWSVSRQQAKGKNILAFLGASRTQFGIEMETVRQLLPEYQPLMLGINGQYPLATLRSLAEDRDFSGIALVDVDARGMALYNRWAQQYYNNYYRDHWTPSWYYHRQLLSLWQEKMAIGYPMLSVAKTVSGVLEDRGLPFIPYTRIQSDRSGYIDFSSVNPRRLADSFAKGLQQDLETNSPPSPEQWLAELAPVYQWVEAIEARGGKVIFYEPPVSGRQFTLSEKAYPHEDYWQRFIDYYQLTAFSYQDEPELLGFDLPDESHIGADNRTAYTWTLVEILKRRNLL